VLFPEQGHTKRQLAEYYVTVAPLMLPHLRGRPLTLLRCPQGRNKACFFQKHVDSSTPPEVRRVKVKDDAEPYTMVDSPEGLVGLVQMGVLEVHAWGSRIDKVERPDILVFDLDPDVGLRPDLLVEGTLHLRDLLARLGLQSFLKITGGKGFHLVVPITRRHEWPEAKEFCHAVARTMVKEAPDRYTATLSKAKRKGKIFVDYLRNARDATAVALYSTRAREGAPVAVPVGWDELSTSLRPDGVSVTTLPRRLATLRRDPWEGFFEVRQSVTAKAQRAVGAR
jgi:bifunctional non-homologous end joining protein LigD